MTDSKRLAVCGTAVPISGNDIDTDRIIPARFMKCVTFEGLEAYAFFDERYTTQGTPKEHPFNDDRFQGASILIANKNFGCGSSREHAPQALVRWGMQAIIGESFAEIFAGNCTALGVPAVTAAQADIEAMMQQVEQNPQVQVSIDLQALTAMVGDQSYSVNIPDSSRLTLLEGSWDTTAQLLDGQSRIEQTAAQLPYLQWA